MGSLDDLAKARSGGGGGGGGGGGSLDQVARQRSGGGAVPPPPTGKKGKPKKPGFDWVKLAVTPASVIGEQLALHAPNKYLREAARIESVLAGAPYEAFRHPGLTTSQAVHSVTGLPEMGSALGHAWMAEERKHGGGTTGALKADWAVLHLLASGAAKDYKSRYGKDFQTQQEQQTFSNLMDLFTVVGGASRVGALAKAGSRLGEAGVARSPGNLWQEAAQPGRVSTGKPFERTFTYTTPEGKTLSVPKTVSRSPLRRGVSDMGEAISTRFPEAPTIGMLSRVTRAIPANERRGMEGTLASVIGVDAVSKLSKAGLTRLYWMAQLTNKDSTPVLQEWRNILGRVYHDNQPTGDANFDQFVQQAKQLGFGEKHLERLDAAIKYTPDKHYQQAWDALRQVTGMSEQTQMDANGFSSLVTDLKRATDHVDALHKAGATPEAISAAADTVASLQNQIGGKATQLQQMFQGRRGLVQDMYHANRVSNGPERQAWLEALPKMENFDPQQAQDAIRFADGLAAAHKDPNEFWATRVGDPSSEPAQQFMRRGANALMQEPGVYGGLVGGTEAAAEAGGSPFYSTLQNWISKQDWKSMPAQELESILSKPTVIPPLEYYHAGLDLFFATLPAGARVSKEEFLNHLSSVMNSYDLQEYHFVNRSDLVPQGLHAQWEGEGLISRDPHEGEYHEIVMTFGRNTDGIRNLYDNPFSKGQFHWQLPNTIVHLRFHIFEENGVKKLLIDEVQSDWESEWRKRGMKKEDYVPKGPQHQRAIDELTQEHEAVKQQIGRVTEQQRQFAQEHGWASVAAGAPYDELNTLYGGLAKIQDELKALHGPPPPSMLGPSYYRAAIRRAFREAGEQNVDQIIISDPRVQHVRNHENHPVLSHTNLDTLEGALPGDYQTSDPYANVQMGHVLSHYAQHPEDLGGPRERMYAKDIPEFARKAYGVTPEHVDNAYTGYFSTQEGGRTETGPMPGTRIWLTPEAKAKALKPSVLFQRPLNWGALPKGANELLANGDRLVHMFQTADISTWIHELSHSAVYDLSAESRKIIENHYAGGVPIDAWKETPHENFARDYELWAREGKAPNAQLRDVFARISVWMKAIYRKVDANHEIPPEVRQVFEQMFKHDGGDVPDVFIPHRANLADLTGLRASRGIPRANRVIGSEVKSQIPFYKKNHLALLRSGMLNDDPHHAFEHLTRSLMLARANQLREMVLHLGVPLEHPADWNPETQYIVKRAGSGTDKPLYDALESADNPEEISQTIKSYLDDNITNEQTKVDAWAKDGQLYKVDKKTVDSLFMHSTGRKPGATTAPKGATGKVFDAGMNSLRSLLLYANPGFYMANMAGNAFMTTISDPRAFRYFPDSLSNALKKATGKGAVDPLWDQVSVQMGRGPTAGMLNSDRGFLGQGLRARSGTVGGIAEYISGKEHSWGARSGRVIDDSFRVAAWKQVASKRGFKTPLQQQRLLDEAVGHSASLRKLSKADRETAQAAARHELSSIRDEAENLMLDFDSMTPFERQWLTRAIFLYPFLRASVKYPIMFAGERPVVAGALGTAGTLGTELANQEFGPRDPNQPFWAEGYSRTGPGRYANFGSVSPFQPLLGMLQSAESIGSAAPIGVQRPWSYLVPGGQLIAELARSQNKYGRDASAGQILRQDFPMPGYLPPLLGLRQPSAQFTDRSAWGAFLRSLRVVPFGMGSGQGG